MTEQDPISTTNLRGNEPSISDVFESLRKKGNDSIYGKRLSVATGAREVGTMEASADQARIGFGRWVTGMKTLAYDLGIGDEEDVINSILAQQESERLGKVTPSFQKMMEAEGVWDAFKTIVSDPVGTVAPLSAGSAASFIPAIVGGAGVGIATGNPILGLAAASVGGGLGFETPVDFKERIADAIRESGGDPNDRDAWAAALNDPDITSDARSKAAIKGGVISAVGMAFAPAAGKPYSMLTKGLAAKGALGASGAQINRAGRDGIGIVENVGRRVAGATADVGVQMAGEAIGEAASQIAAGDELDGKDVLFEAFGSFGFSAAETAVGMMSRSNKQEPISNAQFKSLKDTLTAEEIENVRRFAPQAEAAVEGNVADGNAANTNTSPFSRDAIKKYDTGILERAHTKFAESALRGEVTAEDQIIAKKVQDELVERYTNSILKADNTFTFSSNDSEANLLIKKQAIQEARSRIDEVNVEEGVDAEQQLQLIETYIDGFLGTKKANVVGEKDKTKEAPKIVGEETQTTQGEFKPDEITEKNVEKSVKNTLDTDITLAAEVAKAAGEPYFNKDEIARLSGEAETIDTGDTKNRDTVADMLERIADNKATDDDVATTQNLALSRLVNGRVVITDAGIELLKQSNRKTPALTEAERVAQIEADTPKVTQSPTVVEDTPPTFAKIPDGYVVRYSGYEGVAKTDTDGTRYIETANGEQVTLTQDETVEILERRNRTPLAEQVLSDTETEIGTVGEVDTDADAFANIAIPEELRRNVEGVRERNNFAKTSLPVKTERMQQIAQSLASDAENAKKLSQDELNSVAETAIKLEEIIEQNEKILSSFPDTAQGRGAKDALIAETNDLYNTFFLADNILQTADQVRPNIDMVETAMQTIRTFIRSTGTAVSPDMSADVIRDFAISKKPVAKKQTVKKVPATKPKAPSKKPVRDAKKQIVESLAQTSPLREPILQRREQSDRKTATPPRAAARITPVAKPFEDMNADELTAFIDKAKQNVKNLEGRELSREQNNLEDAQLFLKEAEKKSQKKRILSGIPDSEGTLGKDERFNAMLDSVVGSEQKKPATEKAETSQPLTDELTITDVLTEEEIAKLSPNERARVTDAIKSYDVTDTTPQGFIDSKQGENKKALTATEKKHLKELIEAGVFSDTPFEAILRAMAKSKNVLYRILSTAFNSAIKGGWASDVKIVVGRFQGVEAYGAYDPPTKTIYVNLSELSPQGALDTLAHEFTHEATIAKLKEALGANATAAQKEIVQNFKDVIRSTRAFVAQNKRTISQRVRNAIGDPRSTEIKDENVIEFATDILLLQDLQQIVSEASPNIKGTVKSRNQENLLQMVLRKIVELVTGRKVASDSPLAKAFNDAFNFVAKDPTAKGQFDANSAPVFSAKIAYTASNEYIPGANSGVLAGLLDPSVTYDERLSFTNDIQSVFRSKDGTSRVGEIISEVTGEDVRITEVVTAASAYFNSQGVMEFNPTTVSRLEKGTEDHAKFAALIKGYALSQEGIGGFKSDPKAEQKGLRFNFGRPPTVTEVAEILEVAKAESAKITGNWEDAQSLVYVPNEKGFDMFNVNSDLNNIQSGLLKRIGDSLKNLFPNAAEGVYYNTETYYEGNNWTENKKGESYREPIARLAELITKSQEGGRGNLSQVSDRDRSAASGRLRRSGAGPSDLLGRVDDLLISPVNNILYDYAGKYGTPGFIHQLAIPLPSAIFDVNENYNYEDVVPEDVIKRVKVGRTISPASNGKILDRISEAAALKNPKFFQNAVAHVLLHTPQLQGLFPKEYQILLKERINEDPKYKSKEKTYKKDLSELQSFLDEEAKSNPKIVEMSDGEQKDFFKRLKNDKTKQFNKLSKKLSESYKEYAAERKRVVGRSADVGNIFGKNEKESLEKAQEIQDAYKKIVKANLKTLFGYFSEKIRNVSRLWYFGANKISQDLAKLFEIPLEAAAAVLAAHSPQTDWFMNVALATRTIKIFKERQDTKIDEAMIVNIFERVCNLVSNFKTDEDGNVIELPKSKNADRKNLKIIYNEEGNFKSGIKEVLGAVYTSTYPEKKTNERINDMISFVNRNINKTLKEMYQEKPKPYVKKKRKNMTEEETRAEDEKQEAVNLLRKYSEDQAIFVRAYSEAHDSQAYPLISADGEYIVSDKNRLAWGSYSRISNALNILRKVTDKENAGVELLNEISKNLGNGHKVRSFYNNIIDPLNANHYLTMDTHAVAGGVMLPLSGESLLVVKNFGGVSGGAEDGFNGSYVLTQEGYLEATREINEEYGLDLTPAQLQSVTWETARLLFPADIKDAKFLNEISQIQSNKYGQQREKLLGRANDGDFNRIAEETFGGLVDRTSKFLGRNKGTEGNDGENNARIGVPSWTARNLRRGTLRDASGGRRIDSQDGRISEDRYNDADSVYGEDDGTSGDTGGRTDRVLSERMGGISGNEAVGSRNTSGDVGDGNVGSGTRNGRGRGGIEPIASARFDVALKYAEKIGQTRLGNISLSEGKSVNGYRMGGWFGAGFLNKAMQNIALKTGRLLNSYTRDVERISNDIKKDIKTLGLDRNTVLTALGSVENPMTQEQVNLVKEAGRNAFLTAIEKFATNLEVKNVNNKASLNNPNAFTQDVVDKINNATNKLKAMSDTLPATTYKRIVKSAERYQQRVENATESKMKEANIQEFFIRQSSALESLPASTQKLVKQARILIDKLSELAASVATSKEQAREFRKGIGFYLNRSFRIFDDPNWADKIREDADVVNNAKKIIGEHLISNLAHKKASAAAATGIRLTYEDAYAIAKDEITAIDVDTAFDELLKMSPTTDFLEKRNVIAEEIQNLLGTYTAPNEVFTRTAVKLATWVSKQSTFKEMAATGLKEGWFSKEQKGGLTQVPEGGNYGALSGLYVPQDFLNGIEAFYKTNSDIPAWLKLMMRATGTSMYAKTVLSFVTQVRNFWSNFALAAASGALNNPATFFKDLRESLKIIKARFDTDIMMKEPGAFEDFIKLMIEEGVLDNNVDVGLLKALMMSEDFEDNNFWNALTKENKIAGGIRKAMDTAQFTYSNVDGLFKIAVWAREKRNAMQILGMDDAQSTVYAAGIVRDVMPTYSNIPQIIKELKRFPFVAPFVSFSAEMVRTTYNIQKLAIREIREGKASGNKDLVKQGWGRIGALSAVLTVPAILATGAMAALGMDSDDDMSVRRFLPDWQKNSLLFYLSKPEEGKVNFVDLSFLLPHNTIIEPFSAAFNVLRDPENEDGVLMDSVIAFAAAAASPYSSPQILSNAVIEATMNKTSSGRQVYNTTATGTQQTLDVVKHIWGAFEPGTVSSIERVSSAAVGHITDSGRSYSLANEIASLALGQRVTSVDAAQGLRFKTSNFMRDNKEAGSIFTKEFLTLGTRTEEQIINAYTQSQKAKIGVASRLKADIKAAERMGVKSSTAMRTMESSNIPRDVRGQILRGEYIPSIPSQSQMQIARKVDANRISAYRKARASLPNKIVIE